MCENLSAPPLPPLLPEDPRESSAAKRERHQLQSCPDLNLMEGLELKPLLELPVSEGGPRSCWILEVWGCIHHQVIYRVCTEVNQRLKEVQRTFLFIFTTVVIPGTRTSSLISLLMFFQFRHQKHGGACLWFLADEVPHTRRSSGEAETGQDCWFQPRREKQRLKLERTAWRDDRRRTDEKQTT